jgi:uroporphyrinogen-III synthase
MTRTLAVLRPEPGNAATLARAEAAGFAAISLPLFEVRALGWDVPDPAAYDALILTSANALRFGGEGLTALTRLPVFAVGPHTAAAARAAGFAVTTVGDGDGAKLMELAGLRGISHALHLTGRDRTLEAGGPIATVIAVYESAAVPVDTTALLGKTALLHSARAARRLAEVVDAAAIDRATIAVAAFSPAIVAAAGVGWAATATAASPDDAALFAAARAAGELAAIDRPPAAPDKAVMDETLPPVPDPVPSGKLESEPVPSERVERRALPPYTPPPALAPSAALGWRMGVALGLVAFLVGVGLAAFVLVKFGKAGDKSVATVTLPVGANGQPPVVIVPSRTAATVPSIDIAALSSREAELAAKIGDLETRSSAIERDSQRASGYATRGEGLMVAFAARRALDRGLNLGFLEQQLRDRFGATQPAAVGTIVQAARTPVTLEDLRAGLDGVAPELMTGAGTNGWWQSLRDELGNLIVLRRAGTPSPLPADRVSRARRLIEAGQVEAALAEVSRTPGAASADRWTSAARRYIDARRALDAIETAAILAPGIDAVSTPAVIPAP